MHSYVSDPIAWDACLIHAISIMAHLTVGWFEGCPDGRALGCSDGSYDGRDVGIQVGCLLGMPLG